MNGRERMLTALSNGRPDHLPCQVHGWMTYYLNHYLNGMDWYQATEATGLDYAIYVSPTYSYSERDLAKWKPERKELGTDADGSERWEETIVTPKGTLHHAGAKSEITAWELEPLIKTEDDFKIWNEFSPVPIAANFDAIFKAKDKVGDKGIIRSHPFFPGQGSAWQSFCTMIGTTEAIMMGMDKPDFLHYALNAIVERGIRVIELWKGIPADMVETGGGAGSDTVISPKFFQEFCLPYDQKEHAAIHHFTNLKIVYHLCGGVMHMLDLVTQNGADGLETMTPDTMGGNCDLALASKRVGDKLFFIGGFDQNIGFERGNPELVRKMVFECFEATKDHAGYIIAPSDHFFYGAPANIKAFGDACRECVY